MKSAWAFAALVLATGGAGAPLGCGASSGSPAPTYLDRATMLDATTCQACHVDHYAKWAASMHAYASDDPIFLAMNARGQRETGGRLGAFCVKCHAPMALAEGATTDGTNLAQVPKSLHGVTCFFCHTIDAVTGSHDAAVALSGDLTMRGEYGDPVQNSAHASAADGLHDRTRAASAGLCGACHDIDSPAGAHIERTFAEWQASVFSQPEGDTCSQCHMARSQTAAPIAQTPGLTLPSRYSYGHDFPGVDVALTAAGPPALQGVQAFLATALQTALCVTQQGGVRVFVDNVAAGHFFPSGASQDRRVWAEVIASRGGQVIYASGVVPDGTPVTAVQNDPDLWLMRDCMFDEAGKPVDMFWQAASTEGNELPAPVTFNPTDPSYYKTHIVQAFPRALDGALPQMPDQVTLRIRVQPVGLDVLDALVSTRDLDPAIARAMPILDVTPRVTWTAAAATLTYEEQGMPVACVSPSNLNVAADKTAAANHMKCAP